jgi:adenosyl cobinamide kinase/adenosyl cobinamide phosphate guanylyltransferase
VDADNEINKPIKQRQKRNNQRQTWKEVNVYLCEKWLKQKQNNKFIFLFDTVRIWEFSPVWPDFDEFDNLS